MTCCHRCGRAGRLRPSGHWRMPRALLRHLSQPGAARRGRSATHSCAGVAITCTHGRDTGGPLGPYRCSWHVCRVTMARRRGKSATMCRPHNRAIPATARLDSATFSPHRRRQPARPVTTGTTDAARVPPICRLRRAVIPATGLDATFSHTGVVAGTYAYPSHGTTAGGKSATHLPTTRAVTCHCTTGWTPATAVAGTVCASQRHHRPRQVSDPCADDAVLRYLSPDHGLDTCNLQSCLAL